ncbi:MAG: RNA polymerase subunit sigma [Calditrichaeota bacterium]|nr:MAG: RNA polymerase subunit sigma [Calditrichota bacterium]
MNWGKKNQLEMKRQFENIAFQYMDVLYGTALKMTKDPIEAEDLVQDTYLKAYRFFDKFEEGTNFKAWIFKILTNTFINKYRKKSKQPNQVDFEKVEFQYSEETVEKSPDNIRKTDKNLYEKLFDDKINNALDRLSTEFRLVVLLCDVHGFAYKEIAEFADIPIGTVMSRLSRGRKHLQEMLFEYAAEEGYIKRQKK